MNISVKPEIGRAMLALGEFRRQMPHAIATGLNDLAKTFQREQRKGMRERFIVRRTGYADRSVKITHFAKRGEGLMFSEVGMVPPGKTRLSTVFDKFEQGGSKIAKSRAEPVAIPSEEIRPVRANIVPTSLYPKNLRLEPRRDVFGTLASKRHVTQRGVVQLKGKRKTFVLDPAEHRGVKVWGVYQRETRSDIRLLWTYKNRIPIPAPLRFYPTALETARREWEPVFSEAMRRVITSSRR